MKAVNLPLFVLFLSVSTITEAGTFWFPIEGHYPYSSNLKVTAIPDLDQNTNTIKTRLWQKGINNTQTVTVAGLKGFVKNGGDDWDFDGIAYNDLRSTTGKKYAWYDNHTGYDFITTGSIKNPQIFSVEKGKTCGYIASYGQICIEHTIGSAKYQTYYLHMSDIPASLKANGGLGITVSKWQFLGRMSNVSPTPVGVHLHFTTRKLVGNQWIIVDPYGHKPNWSSDTSDDPNNPYLWQ